MAVAGLEAVPPEILAAHSWLRLSLPVLLATIGCRPRRSRITATSSPVQVRKDLCHDGA